MNVVIMYSCKFPDIKNKLEMLVGTISHLKTTQEFHLTEVQEDLVFFVIVIFLTSSFFFFWIWKEFQM